VHAAADPQQLARYFSLAQPPFLCVLTGAMPVLRQGNFGNSFVVLCGLSQMAFVDIHLGLFFLARGVDLWAAAVLAEAIMGQRGLLHQLGCVANQVEVVIGAMAALCDKDGVLQELEGSARCDAAFLDAFASVAPSLMSRWSCRLCAMGDVWAASETWVLVRARYAAASAAHAIPHWLLPVSWFLLHQLRFSDTQFVFAKMVAAKYEWRACNSEEELEELLLRDMSAVIEHVTRVGDQLRVAADGRCAVENSLIPNEFRHLVGVGAKGPRSWHWATSLFALSVVPWRRRLLSAMIQRAGSGDA
jgi:hypothetical protein